MKSKPKLSHKVHTEVTQAGAAQQKGEALLSSNMVHSAFEFLGGERILKHKVETKLDVHSMIRIGVPSAALQLMVTKVPQLAIPEILQKTIGMSLRTLQRKKAGDSLLTSEQSGKAWDFAEIITKASNVFGSQEDGFAWLMAPAMALNGERPIDLISTSAGREMVVDLLTRFDFGVYT